MPSGLSPAGLTTKQAAKDKVELLEAATEKEKGEEKEMEGEEEKGTTTKEVEIKSAAVPALMDKTPTTPITEDRQAVDEPAPSPTSFSKEQPNMSAKFLPRRLSQELPSDLFEVDRPLSRPPSRASFPSRPVSGARPSRPVPPQRPGTEDTSERRPSKPCSCHCEGRERQSVCFPCYCGLSPHSLPTPPPRCPPACTQCVPQRAPPLPPGGQCSGAVWSHRPHHGRLRCRHCTGGEGN